MLVLEGILDRIHELSLGEWTPESDHSALCIDLKCTHRFDCDKDIEENKQLHLSMNLKRAPMYSKIVENMLQMTKIQHEATLECKWEAFKNVIFSCTNMFFDQPHMEIHQEMLFKEKMVG